jgi:hypothetical protein
MSSVLPFKHPIIARFELIASTHYHRQITAKKIGDRYVIFCMGEEAGHSYSLERIAFLTSLIEFRGAAA